MSEHAGHMRHETGSLLLHWATPYDLLLWFLFRGRERGFRERLIRMARLQPGDSVLDVGCGTGTLAITIKKSLGNSVEITGLDASREMIARATGKAARAGVHVDFHIGSAETLPFPDSTFDVVCSTMMLHHLGPKLRRQCAAEIRRVLKPGGRWFVVDFEGSARHAGGILSLFRRHGHIKPGALRDLVEEAGLTAIDQGPAAFRNLHYLLATTPCPPQIRTECSN